MAEKAYPFTNNGTGDGTTGGYTAAEWRKIHRHLFGDGVALEGNKLAVSGSASPLTVATGHAVIDGLFYDSTTNVSLTVATPTVGTTGGHVVLEADYTAQTVRVKAIRNTDGNSAIPSLTQTSESLYQIRLATFTITTSGVITLTDARTFLHFASMVATATIDDGAVTSAKIADGAVTSAKIADGTIATGDLANDAVDDTKVGNRVPQFYRRQGGSASDWKVPGTNNQTPTSVRMQAGIVNVAVGGTAITFPVAFNEKPLIFTQVLSNANGYGSRVVDDSSYTASGCTLVAFNTINGSGVAFPVLWLAIGPE